MAGMLLATIALLANTPILLAASSHYDYDIAVYDRFLAEIKPGQKFVAVGDFGLTPAQLRTFRDRLVAARDAAQTKRGGAEPDFTTPPNTTFKWTVGNVYYRFDPTQTGGATPAITAPKMQEFRDGVAEWAAFANLHFIEFTGTPPANYITVQEDPNRAGGFSSSIGMGGGQQMLLIGPTSWNRNTICHEVGHALGLYHEQQRDDRDTYINLFPQNYLPGADGNFTMIPGGTTAHGAYDFYSVMHYARNALSVDPATKDTIEPKPAYIQYLNIIGRVGDRILSKLDRAGMAEVYGNPTLLPSPLVTNTNDSGPGSLRTAIYYAFDRSTDAPPVPTAVTFHIPTTDLNYNVSTGVFSIKPTYEITAPGSGTTIDGATQTAFTGNTNTSGPEIMLDGSQLTASNLGLLAAGVVLRDTNCTIRNLIINGFNADGIVFDGDTAAINGVIASGNEVTGCYIGTDQAGTVGIGNGGGRPGIEFFGGPQGNTIGGTTAALRNVISGNSANGIVISGAGANGNAVVGNYIGTTAAGTAVVSNAFAGVAIVGGAKNNVVGGTATGAGNVISGNQQQGLIVADAGTTGNVILGNFIGTNPAGTAALPNTFSGIQILGGAQSNTIGGTTAAARNLVSGNNFEGIVLTDAGTSSNLVQGNFIGTDATGMAAIPNGFSGVSILTAASSNTIGGLTSGARNIISGNSNQGVAIANAGTNSNLVQGNYIGVNASANTALGNGFAGVSIFGGAQSNLIGGTAASARNIISGNANQGITISDPGTNANTLQGNYIGTNAVGTSAIANAYEGVAVYGGAQSNVIGGTTPGTGNVLSGNSASGVGFFDSVTTNNFVQGNSIGLNAAGTAAIPNAYSGVECYLASNNTIGGTTPGARNYISGNSDRGVLIDGANATGNFVQGNTIGLARNGSALPNGTQGISMFTGAHGNTIGGSGAGASNVIASNTQEGIALYDSSTSANTFSRNSIYGNQPRGIGLYTSSNNSQVAPVISSAVISTAGNPNGTDVGGSITGAATIEFFANPPAGDEGKVFLGTLSAAGGSFSASLASTFPVGYTITATATASSNTSQFSSAINATTNDSDGDGIPDNWMNAHFNHATGQAADKSRATDDADGDGFTNLQEFLAGTDPRNASSRFRITSVTSASANITITFSAVAGKTYRVEYNDDLTSSTWLLLQDQLFATGSTLSLADVGATALPHRFYRAVLEP